MEYKMHNKGILETQQVLYTNFVILEEQSDMILIRIW